MTYSKTWIDDVIDSLLDEKWQHIKERNEQAWRIRQKLMRKIEIKMAAQEFEHV